MHHLDHIIVAIADLDEGIRQVEASMGVRPDVGGYHPTGVTKNALMSLGGQQYLEIIAPDPQQDLAGTLGNELIQHGGSGIRSWAVATDNLSAVTDITTAQGLNPRPVIDMNRTTPAGVRLYWQVLQLRGNRMLPFFIDWKNSPHPALTTPAGCALAAFTVSVPKSPQYQKLMDALHIHVTVVQGVLGFNARLECPNGVVELSSW